MLITRPNHDLTTNYLFFWSKYIIDYAYKTKEKVIDLLKRRANYKEFNSIVEKTAPSFIVFNGHGNESTIAGYDNEPLVECSKNSNILNSKIVYARSCSSVIKLGKESVQKGCKAYIGYDDDFIFTYETDKITKPLQDKTAETFLKPSNQIAIYLLKGYSAKEANDKSKELYKKQILQFMTSDATNEQKELVPTLFWDYQHQICIGDQNAKL